MSGIWESALSNVLLLTFSLGVILIAFWTADLGSYMTGLRISDSKDTHLCGSPRLVHGPSDWNHPHCPSRGPGSAGGSQGGKDGCCPQCPSCPPHSNRFLAFIWTLSCPGQELCLPASLVAAGFKFSQVESEWDPCGCPWHAAFCLPHSLGLECRRGSEPFWTMRTGQHLRDCRAARKEPGPLQLIQMMSFGGCVPHNQTLILAYKVGPGWGSGNFDELPRDSR